MAVPLRGVGGLHLRKRKKLFGDFFYLLKKFRLPLSSRGAQFFKFFYVLIFCVRLPKADKYKEIYLFVTKFIIKSY